MGEGILVNPHSFWEWGWWGQKSAKTWSSFLFKCTESPAIRCLGEEGSMAHIRGCGLAYRVATAWRYECHGRGPRGGTRGKVAMFGLCYDIIQNIWEDHICIVAKVLQRKWREPEWDSVGGFIIIMSIVFLVSKWTKRQVEWLFVSIDDVLTKGGRLTLVPIYLGSLFARLE